MTAGVPSGVNREKNRNRKIAAVVVLLFIAAAAVYCMRSVVKKNSFSLVMEQGGQRKIGGSYKDWKSSDPSVVKVDQKGNLQAVAPGHAAVTAKGSWGRSGEWLVTVCRINTKEVVLAAGDTFRLEVQGAEDRQVRWESADNRVVRVDEEGMVTAIKGGSVLVFCRIDDYELKCRVNIPSLAQDVLVLSRQGYGQIKVFNSGDKKITYISEDETIAKVSEDGVVTGVSEGSTRIFCQLGEGELSLIQQVEVMDQDVSNLIITVGQTYTAQLDGISGGEWSSEDPGIARVDSQGMITGIKTGQTRVKVVKDGSAFIIQVNVAALAETEVTVSLDEGEYVPEVIGGIGTPFIEVDDSNVAEGSQGRVLLKAAGDTLVHVSCGEAVMDFTLHVTAPKNVVTKMADLPMQTRKARVTVTIHSYPADKTYTVFNQADGKNKTKMFPHYMPAHGCAACSTSVVLTGYGYPMTPAVMVEKVERKVLGDKWVKNYSKNHRSRMPMTLYGVTRVLDYYKIANTYVRTFEDGKAREEILGHLRLGKPVIFEVKNYDRYRKKKSRKWSNSYHTMVLLGLTDTGKVIVADPANRSSKTFGTMGRLKYVDFEEVLPYMFSCTSGKKYNYFSNGATAGGYILIDQ